MTVIEHLISTNGISPTIREIGTAIGLTSSSTVHTRLLRLKQRGWITWIEQCPRTIRVNPEWNAE